MSLSPFNEDQQSWMRYLASLPREKVCPCGWYTREECDARLCNKRLAENRVKAGAPPHPQKL